MIAHVPQAHCNCIMSECQQYSSARLFKPTISTSAASTALNTALSDSQGSYQSVFTLTGNKSLSVPLLSAPQTYRNQEYSHSVAFSYSTHFSSHLYAVCASWASSHTSLNATRNLNPLTLSNLDTISWTPTLPLPLSDPSLSVVWLFWPYFSSSVWFPAVP